MEKTKIELDRAFVAGWMMRVPPRTEYLTDEEYEAAVEIENEYLEKEWPRVKAAVRDMANDVPEHERFEMRRRYIQDQIHEKKLRYLETQDPKLEKELKRLLFEAKLFTNDVKGTDIERVVRARNFPLEKLIKHVRYMAVCPFHKDHSPSLNIKNNFYFCHGCGATGDVIDFFMWRENIPFIRAVELLANGTV